MDEDLEARIDELYALALERFVPERDALVKALRAEGRRDEAIRVAGLNKPSVAAWAVNQVVRSQSRAARALWEAGDAVLGVQAQVMAGQATGADLRAAVDRERAALGPLTDAARGLVTGNGRFLGDPNVQAVTETLHAAAVDPQAREVVAGGRAIRPLQVTGIGQAGAVAPAAREPARAPRPDTAPATPGARRLAERDRADAAAEVERRRAERERRARRTEAQRALVRAERDRERARDRVAAAARDRDEATARVQAAMRELDAAEDALGRAERALAEGQAALEEAEGAVDAAREEVEEA